MSIDRNLCKTLRGEIDLALADIGRKYGVDIRAGNAKFTPNTIDFKLEVRSVSATGDVYDERADEFSRNCRLYGLEPSDQGREFWSQGKKFVVHGIATRNRKYPVIANCVTDGKSYKFPASRVKQLLAA